jgi:hypothetical protein
MDRGVLIGGGLICTSFLVAVLLNDSARESDACGPDTEMSPSIAHESECPPDASAQPKRTNARARDLRSNGSRRGGSHCP